MFKLQYFMHFKNYINWIFFPSKYLFGGVDSPEYLDVLGWERLKFVSDQKRLLEINKSTGSSYLGGQGNAFLAPLFGDHSAFTLDGSEHRLARRLISSAMSQKKLSFKLKMFMEDVSTELDPISLNSNIDVGAFSRRFTMRTMCRLVLGENSNDLFERVFESFEATTGYLANFVSYNKCFWYPTGRFSVGAIVKKRVLKIDQLIYELISKAKEKDVRGCSVLDELVNAQSQHGYSDTFIRDNLVCTIAAGYDTTGSAITWSLFWLSNQCERTEFRLPDGTIDEEYLNAFILESLRICPPIEILPRRVASDLGRDQNSENAGGSQDMLCPCPHRVHHDENIFREPDKFMPMRFKETNYSATEFFPFGASSRLCLGANLAPKLIEMVLRELLNRDQVLRFSKKRFNPIRRNVSLWPSFFTRGKLVEFRLS